MIYSPQSPPESGGRWVVSHPAALDGGRGVGSALSLETSCPEYLPAWEGPTRVSTCSMCNKSGSVCRMCVCLHVCSHSFILIPKATVRAGVWGLPTLSHSPSQSPTPA